MAESARFHGLDFLRAAIMLLGVVLHVALSYLDAPADGAWPLRDPHPTGIAAPLVLAIHAFRMPAFFVLSGLLGALVVSRKGMGAWIGDRARRILFPMVVAWVILFPLVKLAFAYAIARAAEAAGGGDHSVLLLGSAMRHPWADPSPVHLWFLVYLVWFCGATLCGAAALRGVPRAWRESIRAACSRTVLRWCSGWRSVVGVVAAALFAAAPMLAMPTPGIATPQSFAPDPAIFLCYGVYFLGGWVLALDLRSIDALKRGAWWRIGAGGVVLVVAVGLSIAWHAAAGLGVAPGEGGMRVLLAVTQFALALAAWLLALGGAGAVERVFTASNRVIRFVSDSSYWIYLVHLPISILVVGVLVPWNASGMVKMCAAMALAATLSLLSYAAARAVLPKHA